MRTSFLVSALASGLLFGLGLAVSGMTQPQKVIRFLDVIHWDPSLAFVMVGAISMHAIAFRLVKHRDSTFLGSTLHLPTRKDIDPSLVIGSAIFGIGWGIGGYCPGPALASMGSNSAAVFVFVASMLIGMGIHWYAFNKRPLK